MIDYIHLAIPFFLLSILVEAVMARIAKRDLYHLDDSIASLSCGATQQAIDALARLVGLSSYLFIYAHFRLNTLPEHAWPVWLLAFVGHDLLYYVFHRASHRVNLIWGSHVPHHQSEEFNLTTALRQGGVEAIFAEVFYVPVALLGVPPLPFYAALQLTAIYQFWVHTRLIGRLGPLEQVLVTPSHHRVHHGKNPRYIDKNYGAILILWDRLFGTFQQEDPGDEVVYGTVHTFQSRNPIWANLEHWQHVAKQAWQTPRWLDKLRVWIKPPGWDPANPGVEPEIPAVSAATVQKYQPIIPGGLLAYAFLQFLPPFGGFAAFLNSQAGHGSGPTVAAALITFGTLAIIGGILEAKAWAWPAEGVRLLGALALFVSLPGLTSGVRLGGSVAVLVSAVWLWRYRGAFGTWAPEPVPVHD